MFDRKTGTSVSATDGDGTEALAGPVREGTVTVDTAETDSSPSRCRRCPIRITWGTTSDTAVPEEEVWLLAGWDRPWYLNRDSSDCKK